MLKTFRTLALVSALSLSGLASATSAHAADVTSGHVDIVELECEAGQLAFGSHIVDRHVEADEIGNERFVFTEGSNGRVSANNGTFTVRGDLRADKDIANLGFNYETDGSDCGGAVTISLASEEGNVTFNGSNTVTLNPEEHVHGIWKFVANAPTTRDFTLKFGIGKGNKAISPVHISFTK